MYHDRLLKIIVIRESKGHKERVIILCVLYDYMDQFMRFRLYFHALSHIVLAGISFLIVSQLKALHPSVPSQWIGKWSGRENHAERGREG